MTCPPSPCRQQVARLEEQAAALVTQLRNGLHQALGQQLNEDAYQNSLLTKQQVSLLTT